MQAIIMAAGRGSRLEHLTDNKPKAFLEVKGFKLIEYNIALLHSVGVNNIIIVTGYMNEFFEELVEDIPGIQCIYNPFYEHMNVLGSFFMGQEYLKNEDVIYMHADTLCSPEILNSMIKCDGDIILPVEFKTCDDEAMKVRTESGFVVEISKQINPDIAEGEFIGICKIKKEIIPKVKSAVKKLLKEKKFMEYFESCIQVLADEKKCSLVAVPTGDRFWGEVDFLEDYERVTQLMPIDLYRVTEEEFRHA